jgi:hypothetical protein
MLEKVWFKIDEFSAGVMYTLQKINPLLRLANAMNLCLVCGLFCWLLLVVHFFSFLAII